jgi:hypothetical protein
MEKRKNSLNKRDGTKITERWRTEKGRRKETKERKRTEQRAWRGGRWENRTKGMKERRLKH